MSIYRNYDEPPDDGYLDDEARAAAEEARDYWDDVALCAEKGD